MRIYSHARFVVGAVGVVLLAASSCKKADSKSEESNDEAGEEIDNAGTVKVATGNELTLAYPQGLVMSAFPQAVDSAPGTAAAGTVAVGSGLLLLPPMQPPTQPPTQPATGEFEPFAMHPRDKLEADFARLSGEASDCFSDDIIHALTYEDRSTEVCYGFDYGMVNGTAIGVVDQGLINQTLSGVTDQSLNGVRQALSGISGLVADANGEACMVAVGRNMVEAGVAKVEGGLQLFQGMFCQAKKDGLATAMPAIGETLDLQAVFASYDRATVSAATLTRLADSAAGKPVYKSNVVLRVNGGPLAGKDISTTLVHSPSADDNTAYDGVLWFTAERDDAGQEYVVTTTAAYAKTGSTVDDQKLTYEIRRADFNKAKVTDGYLSEDGRIDFNVGADAAGSYGPGNANDYVRGIGYFAFDVNPSTYAGTLSFWVNPGGNYDEAARGFVFETAENADGTVAGCAYSGANLNVSIRKAVREELTLNPDGCFTPMLNYGACGNGNDNMGPQIWKQCFKQEASGYYVVDAEAVTDTTNGFDIILGTSATLPRPDLSGVGGIGAVNPPPQP